VSDLLGVVLSGGRSSRMGRDKSQLLHRSGVNFLRHACDRLHGITEQQIIVGGVHRIDGIETIADPAEHQGPAIGVVTALEYASRNGFSACLVTAVDLPNLTRDDLRTLIEFWQATPLCPACATDPIDRKLQPLVAIYPTFHRLDLMRICHSPDRSLARWLPTALPVVVSMPTSSLRNVNRPEDLDDA